MPQFMGSLNHNEIQSALYNMIISQAVEVRNIAGTYSDLVDKARADGGLYGDQKHFIDTDILKSHVWGADSEASNLLALDRPPAPKDQAIVLNHFRQIRCTVDEYLSKRAFSTEYVFSEFNGVLLAWLRDTKRVYESLMYNSWFGTEVTSSGKQLITVDVTTARSSASSEEEANRLEAQTIARELARLVILMKAPTRFFNDYGFMRSYEKADIRLVFNSKYLTQITYLDLPTIFHKEGLYGEVSQEVLPDYFFGTRITSSNISSYSDSTPAPGKPIDSDNNQYTPGSNNANGCIRSLVEKDVTVGGVDYHVFPSEEIPAGATIVASTGDFLPGEVYMEGDDNSICKIVVDNGLPILMSAFEAGSSFYNPRSLTTNHYLTWGFNDLEHFSGKPFITVKAV